MNKAYQEPYQINHEQFTKIAKYLKSPESAEDIKSVTTSEIRFFPEGGFIKVKKDRETNTLRLFLGNSTPKLKGDIEKIIKR